MTQYKFFWLFCSGPSVGRCEVAVARKEPGAVHVAGLRLGVCDQEAELRGAGTQPQDQGGDRLQVAGQRLSML